MLLTWIAVYLVAESRVAYQSCLQQLPSRLSGAFWGRMGDISAGFTREEEKERKILIFRSLASRFPFPIWIQPSRKFQFYILFGLVWWH